MKLTRCLIFPLVGALLNGCYDKFYGPVICNGTGHEVTVELAVDGGPIVSADLKSDGMIWQQKKDANVTSLTINAGTPDARRFTAQELSRLALVAKENQMLIWKIDGNEVRAELITRE